MLELVLLFWVVLVVTPPMLAWSARTVEEPLHPIILCGGRLWLWEDAERRYYSSLSPMLVEEVAEEETKEGSSLRFPQEHFPMPPSWDRYCPRAFVIYLLVLRTNTSSLFGKRMDWLAAWLVVCEEARTKLPLRSNNEIRVKIRLVEIFVQRIVQVRDNSIVHTGIIRMEQKIIYIRYVPVLHFTLVRPQACTSTYCNARTVR